MIDIQVGVEVPPHIIQSIQSMLATVTDDNLVVTIDKKKKSRSLNANAYFHVLATKLAKVHNTSLIEIKNNLLGKYGQLEHIDDKLTVIILRDDIDVTKYEHLHLLVTQSTKELNGVLYRCYYVVRGSHTYDTAEMATLISGTIQDCLDSDIPACELASTFESKKLKELYGIEIGEQNGQ